MRSKGKPLSPEPPPPKKNGKRKRTQQEITTQDAKDFSKNFDSCEKFERQIGLTLQRMISAKSK
jgi:hypothetical protein